VRIDLAGELDLIGAPRLEETLRTFLYTGFGRVVVRVPRELQERSLTIERLAEELARPWQRSPSAPMSGARPSSKPDLPRHRIRVSRWTYRQ